MQRHPLPQSLLLAGLLTGLTGSCLIPATASAEDTAAQLHGVSVSVTLDQGVVDVGSTQGKMKHYRETAAETASDFEAFKQQGTDAVRKEKEAFEAYKTQIKREFVGYVQSVTLKSGTELVIVDNVAVERKASGSNPARDFLRRMRAVNP